MDKVRLTEADELSLLASVGNEYDVRKLQQAAIIQDRGFRQTTPMPRLPRRGRCGRADVGMVTRAPASLWLGMVKSPRRKTRLGHQRHSDDLLVDEATASDHHTAYVAYQAAKDRYREAVKGRGTDPKEMRRRGEEKTAKPRQGRTAQAQPARGAATGIVMLNAR